MIYQRLRQILYKIFRQPRKTLGPINDILEFKSYSFGHYVQNDKKNEAPIEWLILATDKNFSLLISKYILDCQPYHNTVGDLNWVNSSLREWLNHDFLNKAFTAEEIQQLLPQQHDLLQQSNDSKETDNLVSLLSLDDFKRYFGNHADPRCRATAYAIQQGVMLGLYDASWWWLQNVKCNNSFYSAMNINAAGEVELYYPTYGRNGVRPVIYLKKMDS